jgi:tRNA-splicing ligase RtcB
MKIIDGINVPIKSWCNNPEEGALEQARNLSNLPFIFKQVCLMPDTHQGYGMPIGGVIACENAIIPNAVGVDIGCGMCAVKTNIKVEQLHTTKLKEIISEIRKVIPVGFKHHNEAQDEKLMPKAIGYYQETANEFRSTYPIVGEEYKSALHQLGTLGGGNHFIEIQKDEEDNIWIMIHSGSRNLGYKVAKHYNKVAIELNEMWYSKVGKKMELAFLPIAEDEVVNDYLNEMNYCLEFAYANRKLMMQRILNIFKESYLLLETGAMINIHHNYASLENHFGKNVWVHRKGATSAKAGELGIIPGSQGTASYIVEGLGNRESFMSCSHGAGRKMGRKEAKTTLNLEAEQKLLNDKNIIHSIRSQDNLDEATSAYKDIDIVMEEQKDLVKIITKLEPLAVIKG